MKKPEDNPETTSTVVRAIRSKSEGKPSVTADLAAMEAALLAEIEAFDLRAVTVAPETPATSAVRFETHSVFPEIVMEKPRAETAPPAAPNPPPAGKPGTAPHVSLLDQLRQQAQSRQHDDAARQRELKALSQRLDGALRRIFSYCHELVQQLNIVRPPVERHYNLLGNIDISGLEWQKGFADYRTRPDSAGALYEVVTLSCQLARPDQLRIERDGLAAENFRKTLFDNGVVFTCDEIRNTRHMVEKVIFSIAADVKVNLRWCADPNRGAVVLETRNLERFGSLNYVLAPEAIDSVMLDELGRLLLGHPSRFRDYCSTLGPAAYSR